MNATWSIDSAFPYKAIGALIDASKELGLEGNRDRDTYISILSCFLLLPLEQEAPVKRFESLHFHNLIDSR